MDRHPKVFARYISNNKKKMSQHSTQKVNFVIEFNMKHF